MQEDWLSHNLLAATGPKDVDAVKSTAQNFEKIGRKSGTNGVCYDKQKQCIIIRKKITATRACRRDYTHAAGAEDCKTRERERERGRETRGCLWTVREPRGCRFFATARFSPNSGHADICLLRISSSPHRQFVDVEFSFHIWIQDLSSISGFRTCSWFLNSRSDTWILDLSLIPGVQDLLLTPGFGTLFKLWVVVFGMSILGYHPGFFKNFFKILFLIVQAGRDGWMDGWIDISPPTPICFLPMSIRMKLVCKREG